MAFDCVNSDYQQYVTMRKTIDKNFLVFVVLEQLNRKLLIYVKVSSSSQVCSSKKICSGHSRSARKYTVVELILQPYHICGC